MQEPSLEGVWGKLDRADEHFQSLNGELRGLIQSDAYAVRGNLEDERTQYVLRCYIDPDMARPRLLRIGLIFGDGIQNLRIALDHLICQLAIACGNPATKQHQFPILTTDPAANPDQLAGWKRRTKGVEPPYIDAIEKVQPYKADEPDRRVLAIVQEFSNADKHRVVLPSYFTVSEAITEQLGMDPHDLEVLGWAKTTVNKPLENGTEILRVPVSATGPDPHMDVQGHLPLDPAFGDPPSRPAPPTAV